MPSFVIAEKCDGCKGGDKTACMYICPNDLMVLTRSRTGISGSPCPIFRAAFAGSCILTDVPQANRLVESI